MKKINNLAIAIINLSKEINIGSLIRTANAAALKEIIIVGRKKWNKSAATGAHYFTKITKIRTTDEFINYCQERGYNLISVEIGQDSKNIFDYNYPDNTLLVVGNEGSGIPERILSLSTGRVYIPQFGDMECLNVAISGSVAIYDWIRKCGSLEEKTISYHKFKIERDQD